MENSQTVNRTSKHFSLLQLQYAVQVTESIYRTQAFWPLFGVSFFIAFLLNNIRYHYVNGTWLQTHFRWQVQTFIFSLIWLGLGIILILKSNRFPREVAVAGYTIIALDIVWVYYRIIKGMKYLKRGKLMYNRL